MTLTAVLEPRGPAGALLFTDEQVAALGDGARTFPVTVTIGGTTLPLRLARMGGESLVGFSKAARAEAGVEVGDTVTFSITAETGPRTVEVPDDLAAALAADEVDALYEAMRSVLTWAIAELRVRVPPRLEVEQRDFLRVHMKGGEACPRCGTRITEIRSGGFVTNYCRGCQR